VHVSRDVITMEFSNVYIEAQLHLSTQHDLCIFLLYILISVSGSDAMCLSHWVKYIILSLFVVPAAPSAVIDSKRQRRPHVGNRRYAWMSIPVYRMAANVKEPTNMMRREGNHAM